MAKKQKEYYTTMTVSEEDMTPTSEITYATEVIAIIAGLAANEVEGIAGMTNANAAGGMLSKNRNVTRGIRVDLGTEEVAVDLFVIVEYGTPIQRAALDAQENVRKAIESMTGLHVVRVDVHVQNVSFEKENSALMAGAQNALDSGAKEAEEQEAPETEAAETEAAAAEAPVTEAAEEPAEETAVEKAEDEPAEADEERADGATQVAETTQAAEAIQAAAEAVQAAAEAVKAAAGISSEEGTAADAATDAAVDTAAEATVDAAVESTVETAEEAAPAEEPAPEAEDTSAAQENDPSVE